MSAIGRWTSVDPILWKQSPGQLLREGKLQAFSMAPYNYSFNNPTGLKDATGEWPTPWDVADVGFAALSIRDAWNDPSASNIGWAAADVAAAALPLVPSTKAVRAGAEFARQIGTRGPEAIRSIAAGAGTRGPFRHERGQPKEARDWYRQEPSQLHSGTGEQRPQLCGAADRHTYWRVFRSHK
jgi:hypothetical protein